ncbi:MAG: TPM domain-containing protein [Clostridia bacterium]|nr:TPM domain-containing protein [Clostridia bacterium]
MNKHIFSVLTALLMCVSLSVFASAYENNDRTLSLVEDYADLLTDEEEAELDMKLNAFSEEFEMEIAVVTINDLEGRTSMEYADDFYDYNGYGYGENDDGLLALYVDGPAGEREIWITTHGKAISKITDVDIDYITDVMIMYLSDGNYAWAFNAFVDETISVVQVSVSLIWIPLSFAIGFAVIFFILKTIASANKSVARKVDARDYVRNGSMIVTDSYDNFLFNNVTRVARPKNTSSGSSTHTSSSGRSHGGGGKRF